MPSPPPPAQPLPPALGRLSLPTDVAQRDPEAMMLCWARTRQPTREDWNLNRLIITRLYMHEQKSLEDVIAIMADDYDFHGTARAYKLRIKQWGLRKHNKRGNVLSRQGSSSILSQSRPSTLLQLLAPPTSLLLPEKFFGSICSYLRCSINDQTWISDCHGQLINGQADQTIWKDPGDVVAQCSNVTGFFKEQSFVECRQAMSQVFALIRQLLVAEDPRTLECFLASLVYLTKLGVQDIATMLQRYISQMAVIVLRENHPWRDVCFFFGLDNLQLLLDRAYSCVVNTFEHELGPFHKRVVVCRVEYIHSLYTKDDIAGAERQLRKLLTDCIDSCGASDWRSQYVRVSLGWNLNKQGRYSEAEDMGLYALRCAAPDSSDSNTVVRCMELIGDCRYHLGKRRAAEESIREAISVIQSTRGKTDPWAIENMIRIERWLQEWGREDEAVCLKDDIKTLLSLAS